MKYFGETSLASFLKVMLDGLICIGAILYLITAKLGLDKSIETMSFKVIFTYSLFIIGGISLFSILFHLRKIVKHLIKRTPFVWENVENLKRISFGCFMLSITYIINFFLNGQYKKFKLISIDGSGVQTDMEFFIFFFAGCFILILSQVFKQAVEVKEENDLTI